MTKLMPTTKRPPFMLSFSVLAVAAASYSLMQSLVAPALPEIQRDLHTTATAAAWILTAYLLSASIFTPILGRLGDMFGKERMLIVALSALLVGTVIAALASDIALMLLGRVLQGAGGALFPLAFGIIRDEFPAMRVAGGIALISALLGVGGGLGIVLAGPIVDSLGYHWLFWLPLLPIALSLVGAVLWVPESPVKTPGRINWVGAALLSAWLICALVGITEGPTWGWGDPRVLGLLVAAVVLCWLWIVNERAAREPLVDMQMMAIRGVWTVNLAAFLVGAGMYSSFVLIPEFVEAPSSAGYGFASSVTGAGLFMLPSTSAMLVAGPIGGRLSNKVGPRVLLVAGCAFLLVSFVMLAAAHSEPIEIYVATGLLGFGVGLAFAALANLIVEVVPPSQTGVATGMNTVMRTVGGAVGTTVGGAILTATVVGGAPATESGFTTAFTISAGAGLLALLAAVIVPRPGASATAAEPDPTAATA
jgi:EmrB/QacA subfamily drug resistance transporter